MILNEMYYYLRICFDIGIVAIIYSFLGILISYITDSLFQEAVQTSKWSLNWQLIDLITEIFVVSNIIFWSTRLVYYIVKHLPLPNVPAYMHEVLHPTNGGIFFSLAIFLYLSNLEQKLIQVYEEVVGHVTSFWDIMRYP